MRTSRLSRETSHMANTLGRTRQRTRDALRKGVVEDNQGFSASVSTPDIEDVTSEYTNMSTRKRKRNMAPSSPTAEGQASSSMTRRAAMKLEDNRIVWDKRHTGGPKRQPARKELSVDGEVTIHAPPQWETMYALTAEMRKHNPAPVDTMGCERLAEDGLDARDRRFQTLIALMLSSQTKDTVTALTMRRLQTELPKPGLTLERIIEVDPDVLNKMIWAVGFHNNKTKFIKKTAEILKENYDGDIPDTIEGMTSLPGVGPKMAFLTMSSAWGRDEGIGVDVHVHRITNLWGWHKTKTPEETRAALESWLPREKWHDINQLLVGFGQTICAPVARKCDQCTLSQHGLCPSAVVDRKLKLQRARAADDGISVGNTRVTEETITADGSKVDTEAHAI